MGQSNGNGKNEREITLHVPEGMDPQAATMIFQGLLSEMHDLEPLVNPEGLAIVSQALLNDYPKLAKLRKAIVEAPPGARWGISIFETGGLQIPGAQPNGFYIEAYCKMREAKLDGLEAVIKTSNCFGLITSATARGALQMHGFGLKISPPYMPEEEDQDEGARG